MNDKKLEAYVDAGGKLTADQKWLYETRQENKPEQSKAEIEKERSLGWRWPWVVIVFLTATTFCLCWVKVSSIMANKDVKIEQIQHTK